MKPCCGRLVKKSSETTFSRVTPTEFFFLSAGLASHDHAAGSPLGAERHGRAVVEAANNLAFWTLLELIGRQVQTRLNERMIEGRVVFAASRKSEPGQISEHSSSAILAVEPKQSAFLGKLICPEIATNGHERLAQFLPVATVAPIAKGAEPLETMSLADDGARAYHLAAFAPP